MFQEFTLTNPENQCNVMVDIDTVTGSIVDLYCYKDDIPNVFMNDGKEYKIPTKDGKNPAFVHIQRKSAVYQLLIDNGFIFCLDDTEPTYLNDYDTISRSFSRYKINVDIV